VFDWFRNLKTWQKVAVAGGALWGLALLAGASSGGVPMSRTVKGLVQNGPWGKIQLGNGPSTIGGGGCLLTAMTMAANAFFGTALTPAQTNEIGKSAGAFVGSDLDVEKMAAALGLIVVARIRNTPSDLAGMLSIINEVLDLEGFAILNVDYTDDTKGDHFVLINGRTTTGFTAVDPVNGKTIPLSGALRGPSKWGSVTKNYSPTGVFSLLKAA
jgi:hypothetical protein